MKKKEWNVNDYDYNKTYPKVDYSKKITEPGLVLSMREIYQRYAAAGVDLLSAKLVSDQDDLESSEINPEFDDNLDVLQQASLLRQKADRMARHSARATMKDSHSESGKQSATKQDEESKQSGDDDSKQAAD